MSKKLSLLRIRSWLAAAGLVLCVLAGAVAPASATTPTPQNPQSGSVGLQGTISAPPPSRAATITNPSTGRSFDTLPITIAGICPSGTMVKVFSNSIFIGSAQCQGGAFTLQADLFSGENQLIARVYDDLDQAGPDSNTVTVNFNDASNANVNSRVSLTSNYARLGANPGQTLNWPIIISGGIGPYALSIDWGDGKPLSLKSVPFAGDLNIDHVYDAAGIYRIIVKATDTNGSTAFLQLIGVANGTASAASNGTNGSGKNTVVTVTKTQVVIWPSIAALVLVFLAFWIGRRYELLSIRKRIENSTSDEY